MVTGGSAGSRTESPFKSKKTPDKVAGAEMVRAVTRKESSWLPRLVTRKRRMIPGVGAAEPDTIRSSGVTPIPEAAAMASETGLDRVVLLPPPGVSWEAPAWLVRLAPADPAASAVPHP
jgi:hypothetical protein